MNCCDYSGRKIMRRRLKIGWTVFFAVLTVALCVLWVRSYWRIDNFGYGASDESYWTAISMDGGITLYFEPDLEAFWPIEDWRWEKHRLATDSARRPAI